MEMYTKNMKNRSRIFKFMNDNNNEIIKQIMSIKVLI